MAMSCSPSKRAGSKTAMIKLLASEDRFSSSLLCLEAHFWNKLWFQEYID